ncbi:unnamed protein product [Schistosoma margrebowiei]|uniref:Uncharacterized protein n=1 Tax=Schistosoma margrebowiei TaxID=48269 RepID=A0A183LIH1_9TREM|nr:unnamed protein product [Schistosoma margrebowiei]
MDYDYTTCTTTTATTTTTTITTTTTTTTTTTVTTTTTTTTTTITTTILVNQITLDGEALEDVKTFTYLGSVIDEHGGSDADVKARIGKAREVYLQLKNIWNPKQLSTCQHQSQNFQYKLQDSFTVWSQNLENYESYHPEDTSVY